MDKQMAGNEREPLNYVIDPLVWALLRCQWCKIEEQQGDSGSPISVICSWPDSFCFAYSFGTTTATVKRMARLQRAPLKCVFQPLIRLLVTCIGGAGAGGISHPSDES